MRKRAHILFAFILSFIFIYLTVYLGHSLFDFNIISISIMALIIGFYSILPDIDHKGSSITHVFFGIGILGVVISIFGFLLKLNTFNPLTVLIFSALFLVFTYISSNFLKHRGIVHTVQVGLMSAFPLWFVFHSIAYCLLAYVAWHSHLLGDGFLFKTK